MSTAVAAAPFRPDGFIDRKEEQRLFRALLDFVDDARLLTIRDEPARGKSHLLKLLRYRCQVARSPVPVSLVPIDELPEKTPHAFANRIVRSLADFGLRFERFRAIDDERIEFRRSGAAGPIIRSEVNVGEANLGAGGRVSGIYVEGDFIVNGPGVDAEVDEWLRYKAVEAFLEDLRRFCAEKAVVLLIDAYEQCTQELEDWFLSFLRNYVFDLDGRPERLVVVIAGQQVPVATFREMLEAQFEQIVRSIESLSLWGSDDVKEFLNLNRLVDYAEEDIEFFRAKLERGWAIGKAHDLLRLYLNEQ